MTLGTMSLSHIDMGDGADGSKGIGTGRDGFEVPRIDAAWILAFVVEEETWRDGTYFEFVGDSMGLFSGERAVSPMLLMAFPVPARKRLPDLYFRPEQFFISRLHHGTGHTKTMPSCQVQPPIVLKLSGKTTARQLVHIQTLTVKITLKIRKSEPEVRDCDPACYNRDSCNFPPVTPPNPDLARVVFQSYPYT